MVRYSSSFPPMYFLRTVTPQHLKFWTHKITQQIMDLSIFILTNKRSNFTLWARNSVSSSEVMHDKYYCSLCYVSFCNYCFFLLFIFKNYITEKLIMMWEKMKLCSNYMPLIANKLQYSSNNISVTICNISEKLWSFTID